jgi:hypothetical protein
MIIQAPIDKRPMIRTRTEATYDEPAVELMPSHDLRKVGLETSTQRLSANVADLDVVFESRARADVVYCPVCPEPHPV